MASGTRLFVGNLSENTAENDLHSVFSSYGEIINLDLKCKSTNSEDNKKFAFITLSASNYDIESCIKHFSNEDFNGNRLYVTRARESFLERLQRERQQVQKKEPEHNEAPKKNPVIKLGEKLNPRKRKIDTSQLNEVKHVKPTVNKIFEKTNTIMPDLQHVQKQIIKETHIDTEVDKKKIDSDKKRIESMNKKRLEFKQKQMIIKTGLTGIDKVANKKMIFSDNEEDISQQTVGYSAAKYIKKKNNNLFDDEESDDEVNFEIKKQFEGKKGQKILDLQSTFKSDKRFVLDERFMDDNQSEEGSNEKIGDNEEIDLEQIGEKAKQLNILQNVLGVAIRSSITEQDNKKNKPKIGMLRFDPSHPEHMKFLAPMEDKKKNISTKVNKKTIKNDKEEDKPNNQEIEVEKIETSKEQFYKVSETLKVAIAQPATFSLRSLFAKNENSEDGPQEQDTNFLPLEKRKNQKVKNPLDTGEKNPFTYDSSDSETEEPETIGVTESLPAVTETKAVWKENLFFSMSDQRLKEGLAYFNNVNETGQKERRELKSLMKKRIYNKERKNQMFQKKIGGRKKSMKKSYRKKS